MVNIIRLLRGRIEDQPHIFYQENEYVNMHQYQDYDTETLINLWEALNRHYAHVAVSIPTASLQKTCLCKPGKPQTLEYLITDYLAYLKYHIRQIFNEE